MFIQKRKNNIQPKKIFSISILVHIIILFSQISCVWEIVDQWPSILTETAIENWNIEPNLQPSINKCGNQDIFGLFDASLNQKITRLYETQQQHQKVRIDFKLFFIDEWQENEQIEIKINEQLFTLSKNEQNQQQLCGDQIPDTIQTFGPKIFENTSNSLNIEFKASKISNQNTLWAISDFLLEIYNNDGENNTLESDTKNNEDDGEICINEKCFDSQEDLQFCVDVLSKLSPLEFNNTSIRNNVEAFTENETQKFLFTVNYIGEFVFEEICLDQQIVFESEELQQNEDFFFDGELQQLSFIVSLEEINDVFKCPRNDTDGFLVWICRVKHLILFGNVVQLENNIRVQISIEADSRNNEAIVSIIKSIVEG